jgi:hypothetical protein
LIGSLSRKRQRRITLGKSISITPCRLQAELRINRQRQLLFFASATSFEPPQIPSGRLHEQEQSLEIAHLEGPGARLGIADDDIG